MLTQKTIQIVMWEHDGDILQTFVFMNENSFENSKLEILTEYFPS